MDRRVRDRNFVLSVELVSIHHEGAGTPTNNVSRFADGGYTYAIGATRWVRLRAPADSYATLHYNHVSFDICLSGNRMVSPVTDADIALIHGAFLDCLHRDEVVEEPLVRAHRNSPGSSTVCPGDATMARWAAVVNACRPTEIVVPKPVEVQEMVTIGITSVGRANEQPYGWLDTTARQIWSLWGFKIDWDGGGTGILQGTADPHHMNIPGTQAAVGWDVISRSDDGARARVCVRGVTGAEWFGTAHA